MHPVKADGEYKFEGGQRRRIGKVETAIAAGKRMTGDALEKIVESPVGLSVICGILLSLCRSDDVHYHRFGVSVQLRPTLDDKRQISVNSQLSLRR